MLGRSAKLTAACLLAGWLWVSPAFGQTPAPGAGRKPVVEYIVVGVLLLAPLGLVCRSSRRST
jgi:hypothetical protein